MTQFKTLVLFAAVCSFAFCQKTVPVSEDTAITIQKNKDLTIQLQGGIRSAGYMWYLENADQLDQNVIKATNLSKSGAGTQVINVDSTPVPGPNTYAFKFHTVGVANNVKLQFALKAPWGAIVNEIVVTLKITKNTSLKG